MKRIAPFAVMFLGILFGLCLHAAPASAQDPPLLELSYGPSCLDFDRDPDVIKIGGYCGGDDCQDLEGPPVIDDDGWGFEACFQWLPLDEGGDPWSNQTCCEGHLRVVGGLSAFVPTAMRVTVASGGLLPDDIIRAVTCGSNTAEKVANLPGDKQIAIRVIRTTQEGRQVFLAGKRTAQALRRAGLENGHVVDSPKTAEALGKALWAFLPSLSFDRSR